MRVYVARHARTDWNDQGRIQGQANTVLNKLGLQQAKDLARALGTVCPSPLGVASSDLHRARQTTEVVALTLDLVTIYDRRLRECHFGRLDGMLREDIRRQRGDAYIDQENHRYDFRNVGGEDHEQVLNRQLSALRDLYRKSQLENWLLVGHGRSLGTLLRFFDHHKIAEQGDFAVVDLNTERLFS